MDNVVTVRKLDSGVLNFESTRPQVVVHNEVGGSFAYILLPNRRKLTVGYTEIQDDLWHVMILHVHAIQLPLDLHVRTCHGLTELTMWLNRLIAVDYG